MMHSTSLPRMGRQQLLLCLITLSALALLSAGAFLWQPLRTAHASASVTATVNWGSGTGKTTNLQYGLNAYNGYDPAVQANSTYQNNVAAMQPGIVRWHYAGQMNDSSSDRSGWIKNPGSSTYQWDTSKINNALSTALGSSGAFRYGPVKLMDLVNWPSYLDDGRGHLRTNAYDEYANFCAQLVRIINIDGHYGFQYFEVFNELENGSGSAYDNNMAEVGRIYNKVAAAMKAVDSSIKVGGPAFARPDLTYNVDAFFSVAAPNLDFVSYHSYATGNSGDSNQQVWNDANVGGTTTSMRTEYQKYSSRSISYFHDEYNISWNPPDQKMNNVIGAIFDALVITSLVNNDATAGMAWNEGDGWYGKLDASYNRRPASYVYQYMNEDMKGNVVSSSTSDSSKVVILAVKNGNKDAFVLINRSEASQTIQVTFSGTSGLSNGTTVTTKQASASGGSVSSTTVGTLNSGNYTLPSNTVTVLSMQEGSAATPTPAPGNSWTKCADENGTCSFSGTKVVRYGAWGSYAYKTATNSIACNNSTFGDPIPGTFKACEVANPAPTGWTWCSGENGTCNVPGTVTVAYGENGQFYYRTANNSIACNNSTFGDPIQGTFKNCYYL